MLYGTMNGNRMPAASIAGKSEGAICKRKSDAPMRNAKPVEHFCPNGHAQTANAITHRHEFSAQPLAERIVVVHFMKNSLWCHGDKSKSPRLKLNLGDWEKKQIYFFGQLTNGNLHDLKFERAAWGNNLSNISSNLTQQTVTNWRGYRYFHQFGIGFCF